jgi:cell division protein ZipA
LAELRWILLGLGALAIAAIWWWSTRRSGQAPGNAELRESSVMPVPTLATPPATAPAERSIAPLEPLTIRTADFDDVPELDSPMLAHSDPLEVTLDLEATRPVPASPAPASSTSVTPASTSATLASTSATPAPTSVAPALTPATPAPPPQSVSPTRIPTLTPPPGATPARPRLNPESSDRLEAVAPPNSSEKQKIVALRVCAVGDKRWPGSTLMSTLEGHGLAFGRYQVYHRKHMDGRSIFCVASLGEPGTFDVAQMPSEQFRGVTMFAVLPGPLEPLQTVDALFATARDLAKDLSGTVQDAKGIPFSPQRVAALREDIARFQAQLT